MNVKAITIFLVSIFMLAPDPAAGQNNTYQMANRLFQEQKYEEALPLFSELYEENPDTFVFFDRYVDCLINLKELERAEQIARKQMDEIRSVNQSAIKLAEILHLKGDREEAMETWERVLEASSRSIQHYYNVASSMNSRREFEAAIEVYIKARDIFNNNGLFLNELANTYMQAGLFEESVNQYYKLIIQSPEQMGFVQQHFLRMRDDNLYEIAAFELEDQLLDLDVNHEAYSPLYQLLTWLLIETGDYQRAYLFAQRYEEETSYVIYSLFSIGAQFLSSQNYELAVKSFEYYLDDSNQSAKLRAKEELGKTYQQWGEYLDENNLAASDRKTHLFSEALRYNRELLEEAPRYEYSSRVYSRIIDLTLDRFHDLEEAERWYNEYVALNGEEDSFAYYTEGRIALFRKEFGTARQTLTRADKQTDSSDLSERARYFLSLSDFYSGDFDFATIQLRSLERRNSSFYANDAIKLRMWIKNGQRADSTGAVLDVLGDGLHAVQTGLYETALEYFEPILANPVSTFADDIVAELTSRLPAEYSSFLIALINHQLDAQPYSPLREQLMWSRTLLAEQIHKYPAQQYSRSVGGYDFLSENRDYQFESSDLENLYEELLVEFPNGFYAAYTRQKLQELQKNAL
ncbi:MAG: tetratricopeptide repeat protein [Balneolaceae bacterium]